MDEIGLMLLCSDFRRVFLSCIPMSNVRIVFQKLTTLQLKAEKNPSSYSEKYFIGQAECHNQS